MNPEVSKYMREMQRRSAESRWSGLSAEQRAAKMLVLAKARWAKAKRKPKRVARRSNDPSSPTAAGGHGGAERKP